MKILLLNDDYAGLKGTEYDGEPHGRGGAAVIAAGLAQSYAAAGHTVHVLTTHQSESVGITKEKIGSVTVTSLPIRYRKELRQYLSLWNPTASRLISTFLRNEGPFDAVHAHNVHGFLTYHSLVLARRSSKRVIITFHDVMSVSYGRIATTRYLDRLDPRLTIADHLLQAGRTYNPLRNIIILRILRNIDCRVTVSEALRAVLERNGIPVDAVIHNGIATEQSEHSAEVARALEQRWNLAGKKVLFLGGRLRKDKGIWESFDAFLRIADRHSDAVLLLVGDKERARTLVEKYPHASAIRNRIVSTGWLDRRDMAAALSLSSICLTPSVCFDSFPTVNLEAMAAGKPIVGTCFGGTREAVEDGITGFVIDPRDTDAYARAIDSLLSDPERSQRMGAAGRERIETKFSLKKQTEQYLQLLA